MDKAGSQKTSASKQRASQRSAAGASRRTGRKTSAPKYDFFQAQKEDFKELFELFDTDRTGFIGVNDFKTATRALGFELKKEEIKRMIGEINKEGSGRISLNDFVNLMTVKMAQSDSNREILKAFRLFDYDNTGKISFENLKRVTRDLGPTLSDEELREMIDEADLDNDGEVSQDEFVHLMEKINFF